MLLPEKHLLKYIKTSALCSLMFLCCLLASGCAGIAPQAAEPENFHRVNNELYRSGQPGSADLRFLKAEYNLRSVLNLREYHSDKDEITAANCALELYEVPLAAGSITVNNLVKCLKIIRNAPKPLLIHCWHGSDRTGCVVAAYRIVFENQSPEAAIAELMTPEYGHHRSVYPNIAALLRSCDWNAVRKMVLEK